MTYYMPVLAKNEQESTIHNPQCDGAYCKDEKGIVKVYPIGAGGNLILCHACFAHENRFNYERKQEQVNWYQAKVYAVGQ